MFFFIKNHNIVFNQKLFNNNKFIYKQVQTIFSDLENSFNINQTVYCLLADTFDNFNIIDDEQNILSQIDLIRDVIFDNQRYRDLIESNNYLN